MNGAQPLIPPSAVNPMAPAQEHPCAGSRPQLPETGTDDVAPAGSRGSGRPATGKPGLQNEAVWITSPIMMLWVRLHRWFAERTTKDAPEGRGSTRRNIWRRTGAFRHRERDG